MRTRTLRDGRVADDNTSESSILCRCDVNKMTWGISLNFWCFISLRVDVRLIVYERVIAVFSRDVNALGVNKLSDQSNMKIRPQKFIYLRIPDDLNFYPCVVHSD